MKYDHDISMIGRHAVPSKGVDVLRQTPLETRIDGVHLARRFGDIEYDLVIHLRIGQFVRAGEFLGRVDAGDKQELGPIAQGRKR